MTSPLISTVAWLTGAVLCLCAAAAVWVVDFRGSDAPEWKAAATKTAEKIRLGEVVIVHPSSRAAMAGQFEGLPVACDTGKTGTELKSLAPAGIWIVGDPKLSDKLKRLAKDYKDRSRRRFGSVGLQHFWNRDGKGRWR